MYDLISVGSISIDLYFYGKSLTRENNRFNLAIGGKYFADSFYENIGGGGCNVASGVANHGLRCAVFGKIGNNPYKDVILKQLTDKKISTEFCQIEDDYYKISSILMTESGERTIIHYETPSLLLKEFFLHKELKKAKNIYFSPMVHLSLKEKKRMISFLKGDSTLTFVNLPSLDCKRPKNELREIFDSLDVLIINAHEYSLLTGKKYEDIKFHKEKITIKQLQNRVVIITDAQKGSYGFFKGEFIFQDAVRPKKIVDTTGCGDAYTAGFISQFIKSRDITSSMLSGARYAAQKLSRLGAN